MRGVRAYKYGMNVPPANERRSQAERKASTRTRILDAALVLFPERGYYGTAVPLVAKRAGVGPGTIYRHFADKEALVNATFREAKRRLGARLEHVFVGDEAPREQFHRLWVELLDFAHEEPEAFHFLELHDHASYIDLESLAVELEILTPLHAAAWRFQQEGLFRADLEAGALMAFIWGALVGLNKAARQGFFTLNDDLKTAAEAACWAACVAPDDRS